MKNTTKLVAAALTAVAIFIGTNVKAQTNEKSAWRFGVGIEGGIPVGEKADSDVPFNSTFQLGGTARLQYGVSNNLALTLTSGYYHFFGEELANNDDRDDFGIIPLKAGLKAFFTDNLYFGAEAGAGFVTREGSDTKLLLAPTLGWADNKWDVGVKYENVSGQDNNFGVIGLRLAYGFGL